MVKYGFNNLLRFWEIFGHYLGQKMPKSKIRFCIDFFLVGKHLQTNFKIIRKLQILTILFIFYQCWLFFSQKKGQNRESGTVLNFHLLESTCIPNFRKFQMVPKINCGGQTGESIGRSLRFATWDHQNRKGSNFLGKVGAIYCNSWPKLPDFYKLQVQIQSQR